MGCKRFCLVVLALALLLSSCAPAENPDASESNASSADISGMVDQDSAPVFQPEPEPKLTQEELEQAQDAVMEDYPAAAVSVATVENGKLSRSGAWGWAVKGQREMTADTKVRIASISKVVVGLCAMAMAEDGLLDLDAPLSDYWGDRAVNPYSEGQPSVRTLMTHTSSLKDLDTTRGLSKLRGILNSSSSWRSMEPGNGGYWYYSNFGFCVLGTTLELAADQLLDDYLRQRFLEPMGVNATFFSGKMEEEEVATLYTTGGVGRSAAEYAGQSVPTEIGQGASYFPGGFTVSAADMARIMSVLINDGIYEGEASRSSEPAESGGLRLLSSESVAAMETPYFTVDPGETAEFEQCLVLRRQENLLGQDVLYYHTGSAYGVFSLMTYNPETKNGVVVITTGTPRAVDSYGLYALCSQLSEKLYECMEDAA